jgi:hypothetical protein
MPKPEQDNIEDAPPENIPKILPKNPIDESKLSNYDKQALNIALANPELSPCAIDRKIASINGAKPTNHIYGRLKKNEYFKAELSKIQQYHRQFISREIVPLAIKNHQKLLKSKDLAPGLQLQAVKLAYDVEFKLDQPAHMGNTTININDLKVLVQSDVNG